MKNHTEWLINETQSLTNSNLEKLDRELAVFGLNSRSGQDLPTLAISIHDITIHDTKKWFGEADIRIDALVITGYGQDGNPNGFYMPKTTSFARVSDGDKLPIGDGGLLVFHGQASHFLDVLVMVSRDCEDTDNLANLMQDHLQSDEFQGAAGAILGLLAAPQVAAVTTAIGAAAALGDFAYRLLRNATGTTIGLYRNSHLQFRDGFGIGLHPPGQNKTCFLVKDLSFRYEITLEEANAQKRA